MQRLISSSGLKSLVNPNPQWQRVPIYQYSSFDKSPPSQLTPHNPQETRKKIEELKH